MSPKNRAKLKMRYATRYRGYIATYRKDATYFEDWCCQSCYWDWGHGRKLYKHGCPESNYFGLLKKYWKSSAIMETYDE